MFIFTATNKKNKKKFTFFLPYTGKTQIKEGYHTVQLLYKAEIYGKDFKSD